MPHSTGYPSAQAVRREEPASGDPRSLDAAALKQAFSKAVAALSVDMPLLMHGSGDAQQVDPATAQLVAALTVQYMGSLVDAAVESHELLHATDRAPVVPPPRFPRSLQPSVPPPPTTRKRARPRATDEYWDEALPDPKIRGKPQPPPNPEDSWVGVAGVDLYDTRARSAYVQDALSTQSFIFPICHDAYAYGRVTEVQSANRAVEPLLVDNVIMDLVRTEGKLKHAHVKAKKDAATAASATAKDSANAKDASDNEDEDENEQESEEEDGPTWPGVDSLLPVDAQNDNVSATEDGF